MKKFGTLLLTTVLACGMAVPALAADTVATGNNTSTVQGNTVNRTNNYGTGVGTYRGTGMNNNGTMNGWNRNNAMYNGRGVTGYSTTANTARAYANDDGMDWGWLGLLGLLGLAGMRNRDREREH